MGKSAKRERSHLIEVMRAEGKTWSDIAEDFRVRYGANARVAMRWAHGWTQGEVAEKWSLRWPDDPKTQRNISWWEIWPTSGHDPGLRHLDRLAQLYECDVAELVADIGCYRQLDDANTTAVKAFVSERIARTLVSYRQGDDKDGHVDRRHFTCAAALTAAGLADPLRTLTKVSSSREVIGADHVEVVHNSLAQVLDHDAAQGAATLRPVVAALRDQVEDWLTGSYSLDRGVSDELQSALGTLSSRAAWLAFDADDHDAARRYVSKAFLQARIADDPRLEIELLNIMCMLTRSERPRESLQYAEAAQRTAQGWATPRVSALLHLRAARAHAGLGETAGFERQTAKAMRQLDRGPHPDDPPAFHFMTPMELRGLRGLALQALGRSDRAVVEFHSIIEDPDPAYRRNLACYTVSLAKAHARNHDITAASEAGLSAIEFVANMESTRTRRYLAELRAAVEPHRTRTPAARDFAERYDSEVIPA